jgi:hypothetical protein
MADLRSKILIKRRLLLAHPITIKPPLPISIFVTDKAGPGIHGRIAADKPDGLMLLVGA